MVKEKKNESREVGKAKMKNSLNRLQIYSAIVSSVLAYIIYTIIAFTFSDVDLLEMIVVFICFVLPVAIAIPFYISEE